MPWSPLSKTIAAGALQENETNNFQPMLFKKNCSISISCASVACKHKARQGLHQPTRGSRIGGEPPPSVGFTPVQKPRESRVYVLCSPKMRYSSGFISNFDACFMQKQAAAEQTEKKRKESSAGRERYHHPRPAAWNLPPYRATVSLWGPGAGRQSPIDSLPGGGGGGLQGYFKANVVPSTNASKQNTVRKHLGSAKATDHSIHRL